MQSFLNLQDRELVADFLLERADYLPAKERKPYEQMAERVHGGEHVPKEELLQMAKTIADVTWPELKALDKFLTTIGPELEWEAVMNQVRPATALLLKRLRKSGDTKTLDETLNSTDASYAIHGEQEIEIDMVRDEVRVDLFESHKEALEPMIEEARIELEAIKKRLKKIRELALTLKGDAQDTMLHRLQVIEDNVFFGRQAPPLETLDSELQFDNEEVNVPSES